MISDPWVDIVSVQEIGWELSVQEVPRVDPHSPRYLIHRQGRVPVSKRCKGQVGGHYSDEEEGNEEVEDG